MEARKRAKVEETAFEYLKEVLARVEVDLASKRKRREVEEAKPRRSWPRWRGKLGRRPWMYTRPQQTL